MAKRLLYEDRQILEKLLKQNITKTRIAKMIGISRGGLYDELRRCKGEYNADEAQKNLFKK